MQGRSVGLKVIKRRHQHRLSLPIKSAKTFTTPDMQKHLLRQTCFNIKISYLA